ncbi:MAG: hypothetical protein GF368_02955 [Candidatus Aenigmarchaeota archaeon]|nr:hypothetical protein [Candidatus Aenigmarchaeota archaeon]
MRNTPYYFETDEETVLASRNHLQREFGLVPPTDPSCCAPDKLVWENPSGLGVYRVDFVEEGEGGIVIFRYWDQRYDPVRDGDPMGDAVEFFAKNYPYSGVTDSLSRDLTLNFD